jgi:hypothetical protein
LQKLILAFGHSSELVRRPVGYQSLPEYIILVLDVINEHPSLYWKDQLQNELDLEILEKLQILKDVQGELQLQSNILDVQATNELVKAHRWAPIIEEGMTAFYCMVNGKDDEYLKAWFGHTIGFAGIFSQPFQPKRYSKNT